MKKLFISLLCLFFTTPLWAIEYHINKSCSNMVTEGVIAKSYNSSSCGVTQGINNGLTFYNDYTGLINAFFSRGSSLATFTASRDATHPATYIDANGVVQLVTSSDTPRFAGGYYDATGFHSQKGLMIEAAGTNLFVNGAFDTNSAVSSATNDSFITYSGTNRWFVNVLNGATCNNSISTDSKYSRSLKVDITNDGAAANDFRIGNVNLLSLANATTYTVSFWVKTDVAKTIPFTIQEGNDDFTVYNDLGTFTTVAGTWIRITKAFQGLAGGADVTDARLYFNAGNLGTFSIYLESLQIEASPYATSFIPTTAAALTRNAEVLKYENSGNATAAEETIYAKYSVPFAVTVGGSYGYHALTMTDTKNRVINNNQDIGIAVYPNVTDNVAVAAQGGTLAVNTSGVVVMVCKAVNNPLKTVILYVNGTEINSNTTNWTPNAWGTYFYVGSDNGGFTLDGIFQKIARFKGAHTASQVASAVNLLNQ